MNENIKRLNGLLPRDLFVLEDENNPATTKIDQIAPSTTIDQVFDDKTPDLKSLRTILEELEFEIITGGKGKVIFPVTSVNGKTDDVIITKADVKLGRVDNTSDADKPLSGPQREAVLSMLDNYNFHMNIQDLYDHVMDTSSNPHRVTFEQLNTDNVLTEYVNEQINKHNISTNYLTHIDIRRNLMKLWTRVDELDQGIDDRINRVVDTMDGHYVDENAHCEVFDTKEDKINKVDIFNNITANNKQYPTTRSIVEYVRESIEEFNGTLPELEDWIANVHIIDHRDDVPRATKKYYRQIYFVRYGIDSHNEIAVCRIDTDGRYYWDYSHLGTYWKFNENQFHDSIDGITLNMGAIVDYILDSNGLLDSTLSDVLQDYYKKDDIDKRHYITDISILKGTMNGTIRYFINNDMDTMSDDIQVAGLRRIAYLDWITENELYENAVYNRHIVSNAIETRHIRDMAVLPRKIQCSNGSLIGNTRYPNDAYAHEIKITDLAEMMVPMIAGLPDPSSPTNPYTIYMNKITMHPQKYKPGKVYEMGDYSYCIRFTGTISIDRNMRSSRVLSKAYNCKRYRIIEAGGSWQYQTTPEEWTTLGGSNITGHTFAAITLTEESLNLETISIGDRMEAPYDFWIKYIDLTENGEYEYMK